jgi:RNA polymerase sigma-70 factor (ECF subfamily)
LLEISFLIDYLSVKKIDSIPAGAISQDDLYQDAVEQYGPSIERLTRAYEADPERRRDLSQDINFQLWRSFERYDARCSLRTWVYRVAHNVAASHVLRERKVFSSLVSLEELEMIPDKQQGQFAADQQRNLEQLSKLIQRLKPLDRQVIVSYLEGLDAVSTGKITGLSPANVAMKINRIKSILRRFHEGGNHAG